MLALLSPSSAGEGRGLCGPWDQFRQLATEQSSKQQLLRLLIPHHHKNQSKWESTAHPSSGRTEKMVSWSHGIYSKRTFLTSLGLSPQELLGILYRRRSLSITDHHG